jgi:hypothetical protein
MKQLQLENTDGIKKVQSGLANGAKEMEEKSKEFQSRFDNFAKEFSSSLQEELDKIEADRRRKFIRDFLENHARFYDAELYEIDRKKAREEAPYPLPDYAHYAKLRDAAMRCQMEVHNQTEEKDYRNQIGELKATHQERLIKHVRKPDIWHWPLTGDQLTTIRMNNMNLVFLHVTPEGQCR